ncbi:MAG TPA: type II toxin-antitoxin system Phd/YefM family antitoxin [Rubrivivax sp.]|nr:type II toxin-antitoxin system Phd/YefM family antitoxin [Rubrivivax sp.]HPO19567.1 type II toxin-antitoxin system Phd/YefM family antitoxin [Rubrivivax sp.]
MTIATLASREFNQDTARAKNAAALGPVVVTDRGTPSHVLLSCERCLALSGGSADIVILFGMAEAAQLS